MPSDITTIEEVEAGDYTVRVAHADTASGYEAVVIGHDEGSSQTATGPGMGTLTFMTTVNTDDDSDNDEIDAPPVVAPHKWVAVGFAIEAYEWGQVNEETVDMDEAYDVATIKDADLSISDELDRSGRVFRPGTAQEWSGPFTINADETDGEWFRKLLAAAYSGDGE